jgi:integrase
VFGRTLPSGKRVYYYQCYDEKGKRQWGKSTGCSKKTEAVAYCMKLYKGGLLIPEQKTPTFAEFSNGWWNIETCRYLKWRELHEPLSQSTISVYRDNFNNHIKGYFSKYKLDEITDDVIENWLLSLSSEKKLKAVTVNLSYKTLKIMLKEAVKLKIISKNSCTEVKELKVTATEREILTVEDGRKMFPYNWNTVWESRVIYKAHRLAACTGLRIGELRGLRGEFVFDDYIFIKGQHNRYGYVPNTKTKQNRNIPITTLMRRELDELLKANGSGYVFSEDGGATPVSVNRINRQFEKALEHIGISREERLK